MRRSGSGLGSTRSSPRCTSPRSSTRRVASTHGSRVLAAEAGDDELIAFVAFAEGLQHQGSLELDASERCFEESIRHAETVGSTSAGSWARTRLASTKWLRGDFDGARRLADQAEAEVASAQDWAELSLVVAWQATVAASQARLADAVRLAERALAFHRRSGYAFSPLLACPVLGCSLGIRGDVAGAHRVVADWREAGTTRQADQLEVLVATLAGDREGVEAAIAEGRWRPVTRPPDLGRAAAWLNQVEVGALVERPDLVLPARAPLADLYERGVRMVPGSPSSVARLAAVAAGMAEDWDEASRWLELSRRDARLAGAPGELGAAT